MPLFRGFMKKSLTLMFIFWLFLASQLSNLMDRGIVSSNGGDRSQTALPDSLAFNNIKKKQINDCGTLFLKQDDDDPCHFLRLLYESMIAGGIAGLVVEASLYPIDTIKTRVQVARDGGKIIWNGLYSGLGGNLAGVLPASALFFGVYEPTKQKLLKVLPEKFSAVAHLAAGALGGAVSSIVRVPTEVVKQRMQTGQFTSASDAVRLIIAKEGFKGMYAGFGSFLLRDLPFDALQFCVYEQLRIGYKLAAKRDLNDPENAMLGAFAGAVTGVLTTPLDVIKTRLMVQGAGNQYKGVSDCVKTILREEGSSALWKGMGPRILWIGIGGSIFFGVLEKTKQILSQSNQKSHKKTPMKKE